MMQARIKNNMLSLIYKPLCVALLLLSLFGIIKVRSGVVSIEYELRSIEEKKMAGMKEMKSLLAERARLMSLSSLDLTHQNRPQGDNKLVSGGYVFPDRVRVIHIKRNKGPEPYRASIDLKEKN